MNDGRWVPSSKACAFFGVSSITLKRWEQSGNIKCQRTSGGHRRYLIHSGDIIENPKTSKKYIYVRVSSTKQKNDLARQRDFLLSKYPDYKVISDIGSGLNYKRKGLLKLLELSNKGEVSELVVFSKDRLCRFGYELLQWQFLQNNTELVVYDKSDKTPEQEFTEDILAILQVFACRWNGKRKYTLDENKEIQIEVKQYPEKDTGETQEQL
jgi:putative resolvase